MDHRLVHTAGSPDIDALRAFAAKVRRGDLGQGHQVGHHTVQVALRAIGTTFELDGQPNPLYRCASSQRYWKALERQIEGYRRQDRLSRPYSGAHHGRQNSPVHPLQAKHIRATDINTNVKTAIKALGLESTGFTSRLVSSHSLRAVSSHFLRASGAMAMKLNGADRNTIRKQGRWSSDTFLMYIHEQIAAFSSVLATQMSKHIPFINIRGPSLQQTAAPTPATNRILSF
jgi:hypothetical protein